MTDSFDPLQDNDATSLSMDTDGDGYVDTVFVDSTGDGVVDTMLLDSTGNGLIDTVISEDATTGATAIARDLDGDGTVDVVAFDHDGDGLIDEAYVGDAIPQEYRGGSDDAAPGPFTPGDYDDADDDSALDNSAADGAYHDGTGDESDVVSIAAEDGVYGQPREAIYYHQVQPGPVDCLPTSVSMVLSQITGAMVPAGDLVAMANDLGFMAADGMLPEDALTLLENYGVEAELTSGGLDDLREALVAGDPIIVGIDAADLYAGGGGPFDPGLESGHAVVLTGMEDGPPPMIYINDPAFPDGAGLEIPLDLFLDSWEDTDNTMIVATAPGGPDAELGAADDLVSQIKRVILLPLNFVVRV